MNRKLMSITLDYYKRDTHLDPSFMKTQMLPRIIAARGCVKLCKTIRASPRMQSLVTRKCVGKLVLVTLRMQL